MAGFVSIDCPFCLTKHVSVEVREAHPITDGGNAKVPVDTTTQALGKCRSCGSAMILYFLVKNAAASPVYDGLTTNGGDITNVPQTGNTRASIELLGFNPNKETQSIPKHIPDNVASAFAEANLAFEARAWSLSGMGYGKATDRGITPFLQDIPARATLGQKLGMLKDHGEIPTSMLDWIDVILQDRNFLTHDEDRDFTSPEEVLL